MTGAHFTSRMTEGEIVLLVTDAVDELSRRLAHDLVGAAHESDDEHAARGRALAHLYVLVNLEQAVHRLESRAAEAAAEAGATYPEIGRASNLSRQGARRRWPGLITNSMTASTPELSTHPTPRSPQP
ncbi:hypothetical protein [Streptomyces sp. NPDC008150]|uniref:hypothetical protein n=1 Tax=Streptomyces sp. NPDC008150 TaxID=3364816 RepID=UPI0036EB958B